MSEISEINMSNVIHVLGVPGISGNKQPQCSGKCPEKDAELPEHQENVHK